MKLFFIYGLSDFLVRKKAQEIIEKEGKNHQIIVFDFKERDPSLFEEELKNSSLFSLKRFFVLKHFFQNPAFEKYQASFKELILSSQDVFLFWEETKIQKSNSFFKFLLKKANFHQEFNEFGIVEAKEFILNFLKSRGFEIENSALLFLAKATENNPWLLENELEKLVNFYDKSSLTLQDIKKQVTLLNQIPNIFEVLNKIAQGKKREAIFFLEKYLEEGEHPLYLFSMIVWQFRNLLLWRVLSQKRYTLKQIQKKTGLKEPVLKSCSFLARRFSETQLKKIYRDLYFLDFKIKSGKINPELALYLFLARL
jgi:DNA polymerase III subunit delta